MKRLIGLVLLVALLVVPAIVQSATYRIIDNSGVQRFLFVDNERETGIMTENGERVSNSGVVIMGEDVWLLIPDKADSIILKVSIPSPKGPYKIYDRGNHHWGNLVRVK